MHSKGGCLKAFSAHAMKVCGAVESGGQLNLCFLYLNARIEG